LYTPAVKLTYVTSAAAELVNEQDAIDRLSGTTIQTHGLDPDAVQAAIAKGVNRALDRRRRWVSDTAIQPTVVAASGQKGQGCGWRTRPESQRSRSSVSVRLGPPAHSAGGRLGGLSAGGSAGRERGKAAIDRINIELLRIEAASGHMSMQITVV
jgi:hypothetical protein